MTQFLRKIFPNVSRHSNAARSAAELANAVLLNTLSYVSVAAGAARGTTVAKAKFVNNITYLVNGAFYSKNAADDFWTLSGTTVAANSYQKYALLIDTAGAASIQEATQSLVSADAVAWTNVSGVSAWAPYISILGSTKAIVAGLLIATDATHTFIPGTTALNAAGITATFTDGVDQSLLPLIANTVGTIVGNGG